jgi:hypothetical protein
MMTHGLVNFKFKADPIISMELLYVMCEQVGQIVGT